MGSGEKSKSAWAKKYEDPRWQKLRLKVMERAGFECEMCGNGDETLHVHHGYYTGGNDPWEYGMDTLWCLCADCHELIGCMKHDIHLEMARIHPACWEELFWMVVNLRQQIDVRVAAIKAAKEGK